MESLMLAGRYPARFGDFYLKVFVGVKQSDQSFLERIRFERNFANSPNK